jgi:hypothetical protein
LPSLAKGDSGVHLKGVLPWLVRWARHAGKRNFYPALAALVGPVQNIFFLTVHYFKSFIPIARQARKAVVPSRLSLGLTVYKNYNSLNNFVFTVYVQNVRLDIP